MPDGEYKGRGYSQRVPLARDSTPDQPRYMWEKMAREQMASVCPPVGRQDMGDVSEVSNALSHLTDMPSAWRAAQDAKIEAQHRFPDIANLHNNEGDAYRHFLWNAKMTRDFGGKTAEDFANSHEVSGSDPPAEHHMDLYNNAVGRAMAQDPRFSRLSPEQLAEIAYRNACLQTGLK